MSTPERTDPLATAATAVVVAAMACFATYRLVPVDVPWHLATGRWVLANGFMTTNTFSWTHPDHPLYQQYPLFQVPLALLVDGLGFEAGSVFFGALWTLALLAWMRWGAPWRATARWPLLWLGAAVGLQRHAVQRPEAATVLLLGLLVLALDRWRTHGDRKGLVAAVAVQWAMANTHQLFPLGMVIQFGVLAQLAAARHPLGQRIGLDPDDAERDLRPMGWAFLASLGALALSPLGPTVYLVPLQTLSTVLEHGQTALGGNKPTELGPVWSDPIATVVAVLVGGWFLLTAARSRGRWRLDELGIGLMGLLMTLAAVRGISFLGVFCAASAVRMARRQPGLLPDPSPVHAVGSGAAAVLALLLARASLTAEPMLYQVQPGLGKAYGGWGEGLCGFLDRARPPGQPINLGWAAGNPLIGCAFPDYRPFVDPRFEAYPRDFLAQGIQASEDGVLLQELIDRWDPGFAVIELRLPSAQARGAELLGRGWRTVHVDADHAVLAPDGDFAYEHAIARAPDLPAPQHVAAAQQVVHYAAWVEVMGHDSAPLLALAEGFEAHPAVQKALAAHGLAGDR